jgi:hypothetical protein
MHGSCNRKSALNVFRQPKQGTTDAPLSSYTQFRNKAAIRCAEFDGTSTSGAKRPFGEPTITLEAKAWLTSLSCRKAKELGYPHELWTTRLLARHAREHGPAEGHPCLAAGLRHRACASAGH